MSHLEEELLLHIKAEGLPRPEREWRFFKPRRWRFDFAYPHTEPKIGIEVEGGTWSKGRHTRGKGFEADCEKYNTAVLLGWRVLRFTRDMVKRGDAVNTIREALK